MAIPDEPFAGVLRLTGDSRLRPQDSMDDRAASPEHRAPIWGPRYGHCKTRPDPPQEDSPDDIRRRGADCRVADYGRRFAAQTGRARGGAGDGLDRLRQ